MLEHFIVNIALIILGASVLFVLGIRVAKARFMFVDLKDPTTLLPDKPFRSLLIIEGIVYLGIAFLLRPSLNALWAWESLIFVCFLFVGCWALVHGILIVRLCKRREVEKDQLKT
jgi:hypothetical protein